MDKKQSREDDVPTLYLDNLRGFVSHDGVMTYSLNDAKSFITLCKDPVTTGDVITFHLQTEMSVPIAVWVQGIYKDDSGRNVATDFFVQAYSAISDGITITTSPTRECDFVRLQVQTRDSAYGSQTSTWMAGVVTISNFAITIEAESEEKEESEEKDNVDVDVEYDFEKTYTYTDNGNTVTFDMPVTTGQVIRFYLQTANAVPVVVTAEGFETFLGMFDTKRTIFLEKGYSSLKDGTMIMVPITASYSNIRITLKTYDKEYGSATSAWTAGDVTLSDCVVLEQFENRYVFTDAWNRLEFGGPITAGETLSFDISAYNAVPVTVWVEGIYEDENGKDISMEILARAYSSIVDGKTVAVSADRDYKRFRIIVQTREYAYGEETNKWIAGELQISKLKIF